MADMTNTTNAADAVTVEYLKNGKLAVTVIAQGRRLRKVTGRNYPCMVVRWYLGNPYDSKTGRYDRDTLKLFVDVVKGSGDLKVAERAYDRLLDTHRSCGAAVTLHGKVRRQRNLPERTGSPW